MTETTEDLINRARQVVERYPKELGAGGAIDIIAKLLAEIERLRGVPKPAGDRCQVGWMGGEYDR